MTLIICIVSKYLHYFNKMSFPLYDKLLDEKPKHSYEQACRTIDMLNVEHHEIIYLLIYHHCALNEQKLPPSERIGKSYKFDMKKMDKTLRRVLRCYINYLDD